jgi:hypothetical protein
MMDGVIELMELLKLFDTSYLVLSLAYVYVLVHISAYILAYSVFVLWAID